LLREVAKGKAYSFFVGKTCPLRFDKFWPFARVAVKLASVNFSDSRIEVPPLKCRFRLPSSNGRTAFVEGTPITDFETSG